MKRLTIVVSIVAALAFSAAALASPTISGKYRATVTKPASSAGTYTLDFKANGKGTVTFGSHQLIAKFSFTGTTLTAPGGGGCKTAATYKIKPAGNKLTFKAVKPDSCIGRKTVLAQTFTKVG